jgi:hypothetical protein
MKIKDITLIGVLAAILFLIDQVLSFVPFLQFSMLLIVLFSRKLGSLKTSFIILIFVVLGYLLIEFNLLFIVFSIIGWLFAPLLSNTIFKNTRSVILIGLESILFSFLYSWIHIIPSCIIIESSIIEYLKMDIVFELTLAASSFVTIVFLYKPLEKVLDRFI